MAVEQRDSLPQQRSAGHLPGAHDVSGTEDAAGSTADEHVTFADSSVERRAVEEKRVRDTVCQVVLSTTKNSQAEVRTGSRRGGGESGWRQWSFRRDSV